MRDDRDRAGREYAALTAIARAIATFAPGAVWLEQQRYRQPVVVQTWGDGTSLTAPPAADDEWEKLLELYCSIHRVTPITTPVMLAEATLNVASGEAGQALIQQQPARILVHARSRTLRPLVEWVEQWSPPTWPRAPRALCRVDSNWRNFICLPERWVAVDWENSGWGDPAFEGADLMTHPAYADVQHAPWERLITAYAQRMQDASAPQRIATYTTVMLVWWVVRWVVISTKSRVVSIHAWSNVQQLGASRL
jgi:aminoglycoside phosphotransferase (APT) family kinase protein